MPKAQPDLFLPDAEPELFDNYEAPVVHPDPDKVRARLYAILAEARGATVLPWDRDKAGLYQLIFPQMTRCLPDEEAAQLRFEFETEIARLEAA